MTRRRVEELGWAPTPIGEVSLRRRTDPLSGVDVFEVKLGDEFLMSSLFTVAEVEVARLALVRLEGSGFSVAVGGLGLGYTAQEVLRDERVAELLVVDYLQPVIDWHTAGLVPASITSGERCRLVHGDFFALSEGDGFDPRRPGRLFDAVVVDIDHSPAHLLAEDSAGFYSPGGTRSLARHLRPGGVYSLWSNDPPEQRYVDVLAEVFVDVTAEVVSFWNPLQDRDSTNTVYLATLPSPPTAASASGRVNAPA